MTPPLLVVDLDDTLAERPPVLREWAIGFLAENDLDPGLLDKVVEADFGGHVTRRQFHDALRALGYAGAFEPWVDAHEEAVSGGYRIVPSAQAALDDVRAAGWRIAVVTNGYVRRQTRKLRATGMDEYADAICISEDVGTTKPDPAIFRLAAERACATLEGGWVVGDNLDADVQGAVNSGMRSVWVRRPREWLTFTSAAVPDFTAPDVTTALRLVLEHAG